MIVDYALVLAVELFGPKLQEGSEKQNIGMLVRHEEDKIPKPKEPNKEFLDITPHEAYFDRRTPWDLKESESPPHGRFRGYKPRYVRRELRYLYTHARS